MIKMGNVDTKDGYTDRETGELVRTHLAGNRVCHIGNQGESLLEDFINIVDPGRGIWVNQSWAPPAWVEGNNDTLVQMIATHYNIPIGRPEGEKWIE
jgi:hypothetical protein